MFYSLQNTKLPLKISIIAVVVNTVGAIALAPILSNGGIALASSLSVFVQTVLLFIALRGQLGNLGLKKILLPMTKMAVAAVVMGGYCYGIARWTHFLSIPKAWDRVIILTAIILPAIFIYAGMSRILGLEELHKIMSILRRKFKAKAA